MNFSEIRFRKDVDFQIKYLSFTGLTDHYFKRNTKEACKLDPFFRSFSECTLKKSLLSINLRSFYLEKEYVLKTLKRYGLSHIKIFGVHSESSTPKNIPVQKPRTL